MLSALPWNLLVIRRIQRSTSWREVYDKEKTCVAGNSRDAGFIPKKDRRDHDLYLTVLCALTYFTDGGPFRGHSKGPHGWPRRPGDLTKLSLSLSWILLLSFSFPSYRYHQLLLPQVTGCSRRVVRQRRTPSRAHTRPESPVRMRDARYGVTLARDEVRTGRDGAGRERGEVRRGKAGRSQSRAVTVIADLSFPSLARAASRIGELHHMTARIPRSRRIVSYESSYVAPPR